MIKCKKCQKCKAKKEFLSKRGIAVYLNCAECREFGKEKYWKDRDRQIRNSTLYQKKHRKERNEYFLKYLRRRAGKVPLGLGKIDKRCPLCKVTKPLGGFGKNRLSYDGLQSECIECKRARGREYVRTHRVQRAEYNRLYEKKNKKRIRLRRSLWKRMNKDKVNAQTNRRRARIKGDSGIFTAEQWDCLVRHYSPKRLCLKCGKRRKLTIDHVIPIQWCGRNIIGNLQPLCMPCNTGKRDKIVDYRSDKGRFARQIV